ncbi:glucosamine-6-phosphate deaminase [Sporosarcina sp. Marseille-Q4063]|uniref:glucosamine-6-phosphate deaminase n=1 Tax=Sporosarcina sp. Marseille-Q4063 TaxID=2810514 RepID=UPI001BB01A7A|nr:glucosamine-6-phosphate deaminase [Sporosarcina sp. Marseille-Q4063]QUW21614.1 glucosamine-6-phosphate deaminase [Sporosarcina sp. Marseille-Q4063]
MKKVENVKFSKVDNAEQGSVALFQIIKEELEKDRLHSIGLATGNTMIPVYEKWVNSDLDFSNVTTFNLDEYVGISADSPNSYAYFMHEHLFDKKQFKETFLLNGLAKDLEEECRRYEDLLEEHGLDLQLLGVGENGHIAFNEPGTSFDSVTHVAKLTDSTLSVNSQLFANDEKIPDTALSLGIGSILRAKKIVLLAFGERKRAALEKLLEGHVTAEWPITKLLHHDDVTIITDLEL